VNTSPRSWHPIATAAGEPLREGEGEVIADLDFGLIERKMLMEPRGYYSRLELFSQLIDRTPTAQVRERADRPVSHDGRV
jgi:nitrilase